MGDHAVAIKVVVSWVFKTFLMLGRRLLARVAFARAQGGAVPLLITVGDRSCALPHEGMTVLQVLRHYKYPMEFDCMKGSCKKCQVDVELEGERAQILACQEQALAGMHVFLNLVPDSHASWLMEQEARERSQQEMRQRRSMKMGAATKGPPRVVDKRENLDEVKAARKIMGADRMAPAEKLVQLRTLMESMDERRFFDVIQFCKIDDWMKRQKWGKDKEVAAQLRQYIFDRENEQYIPEVETMAC